MKMTARRGSGSGTDALLSGTLELAQLAPPAGRLSQVRSAPLFEGLEAPSALAAAECFEEAHFLPGHRMVVEGLRGRDFYLIVEGQASVLVENWPVAALGPGDFFGEIAILSDGLRSASVRAESPLHCLVLPNGRLEQLLLDHPQLGVNLLRSLVGRFTGAAAQRQRAAGGPSGN